MWGTRIRQEVIFIYKPSRRKDFIFLIKEFIAIVLFNKTPAHQAAYIPCQLCLSGSKMKDYKKRKLVCTYQDRRPGVWSWIAVILISLSQNWTEGLKSHWVCLDPSALNYYVAIPTLSSVHLVCEWIHAGNNLTAPILSLDSNTKERLSAFLQFSFLPYLQFWCCCFLS